MSTLIIENVKDEFLPAFNALSKAVRAKCTIQPNKKPKSSESRSAKQEGKHKLAKLSKFEKSVLKASTEAKQARASGKCKTFASAKEFRAAVENGEI